jgi:hypothetical protein
VAGTILTAAGVLGQTFAVSGSGASGNLASANVQTGSTLATVTGLSLGNSLGTGTGTSLSGNYNALSTSGSSVSITTAPLTVSTGNVIKTYDGTLTAVGTPVVTSGTLYTNVSNSSTQDSLTGGTFAFTNSNAGTGNKMVTVTGITVSDGNNGGNYNISEVNNTTSTINQASLTVTGTTVANKTYDGTTTATLNSGILFGVIAADTSNVNLTQAGVFASQNVGTGIAVTA